MDGRRCHGRLREDGARVWHKVGFDAEFGRGRNNLVARRRGFDECGVERGSSGREVRDRGVRDGNDEGVGEFRAGKFL